MLLQEVVHRHLLTSTPHSNMTKMEESTPSPILQDSTFPSLDSITPSKSNSQSGNLIPPLPPTHPISRKIADILTIQHHPLQTKAALREIANLYPLDQHTLNQDSRHDSDDSDQEDHDWFHSHTNGSPSTYSRVDTQRARENLEKDTDLSLEKATDDFLEVLKGVDQVSIH